LFILVNIVNLIDTIQTRLCIEYCSYCVEVNTFIRGYYPLSLYVKILVVWAWSLVLYRASMSKDALIAKTARAMLILLALIFSIAVVNNAVVLMHARC
jgi:hypothetical protein